MGQPLAKGGHTLLFGRKVDKTPKTLQPTDAGYLPVLLLGYEPVGDEWLNVAVNTDGQLEMSAEVAVGMAVLEQYILDTLDHYKISDKIISTTVDYFGYTDKAGAWYIMKVDKTGGYHTHRYAKGASGYDFTNRESESYDTFTATF